MRKIFLFLIVLAGLATSPMAFAVLVRSVYQAEIPVSSQDEQVRKQAIQKGLEQVFSKLTGNSHITNDDPALKNYIKTADTFVQQYSYTPSEIDDKNNPYLLTISYEPETINKLLTDSGARIWGQHRPLIIVWIATQSTNQPLDILDNASDIETLFKQTAKSKGLPVIFPLGDLADISALNASDINAKDFTKIDIASKRYQPEAILTGVITQNTEDIVSHWELVYGDQAHWSWDITGKTMQDVLTSINENIATTFAARLASVHTEKVETTLSLQVTGVKNQEELMKLMKYLQNIASVADVQLANVDEAKISLDISFDGTKQALIDALSNSKILMPEQTTSPQDDTLFYKWVSTTN